MFVELFHNTVDRLFIQGKFWNTIRLKFRKLYYKQTTIYFNASVNFDCWCSLILSLMVILAVIQAKEHSNYVIFITVCVSMSTDGIPRIALKPQL